MNIKKGCRAGGSKCLGFSLIEAMVGTLVIAFGFLSYAYLANASVKSAHDSFLRTQANFYANSVFERMRANLKIAQQGNKGYSLAQGKTPGGPDCTVKNCSPSEIRDWDLSQWSQAISDNLLDATGEITFKNNALDGTRKYTVTIFYSKRTQFDKDAGVANGVVIVSSVL